MSEELAQEDEDAEDYDLESLERRTRARDDDDDATLVGSRRGPASVVGEDSVVFEIGDQDDDDDEPKSADKRHLNQHNTEDRQHGNESERQGLMNGDGGRHRDD